MSSQEYFSRIDASDEIHLVYASDARYLRYVSVSIGSAFLWASDRRKLIVHILLLDVDNVCWDAWISFMKRHLPGDAVILCHNIDSGRFSGLRSWHGSKGAYARLLLPEILDSVDWCAYADVDTCFTGDPLELASFFDGRYSILGHLEYPFKSLDEQRGWFAKNNLPFDKEKYFCSGFVLMNLKWFRINNAGRKCLDLLAEHPDAPLVDQEALNAVCISTSKALPYEWGCFGCEAFAKGRPKVIHYPGHNPWKLLDNMFPDYIDAYNIWFRYAKFIFGRRWVDYCDNQNTFRYWAMRVMGATGRLVRLACTVLPKLPFITRYCVRHYASHDSWRAIVSCMKGREDWTSAM